ncbi:hypothetical protein H3C65_01600 [Patescibacteria group bacterium]|nr:hypothetical protein [Patescibacteria group bacterium]
MSEQQPSKRLTLEDFRRFFAKTPDIGKRRPEKDKPFYFSELLSNEAAEILKGNEQATRILNRFFSAAYESGMIRAHKVGDREAPPVAMFGRQGFTHELLKRYKDDKGLNILMIDIAGLREDDRGGTADYNLNIFAARLNEVIKKLEATGKIKSGEYVVARYGGDEFSIGLVGEYSYEELESIKKELLGQGEGKESGLDGVIGLKKEENTLKGKPIKIKDGKIDTVSLPDDEHEKKLFLSFLERGFLIKAEELKREVDYFRDEKGNINEEDFKKYLKDFENGKAKIDGNLKDKIEELTKKHPEFKVPFYYAEIADNNSDKNGDTVQREVLEFIYNYLYDPLLGEIAMSRHDLADHLKRGKFSNIYSLEVKVKEINDKMSYAYADRVISGLWNDKLKQLAEPLIKSGDISLGRIGGNIFFGVRKGADGERIKQFLKKVSGISKYEGDYHGAKVPHIIGFANIDVSETEGKDNDYIGKKFEEMFSKTTRSYIRRMFKGIFSKQSLFELFCNSLENITDDLQVASDELDISDGYLALLSASYFNGSKRYEERITMGKEIMNEMFKRGYGSDAQKVKKIFKDIIVKLKEKYPPS